VTAPPLVAVAHGSRDPRSAATVAALVDEVRRQRPDLDVRLSFLDLSAPRLADVLCAVHAEGHRRVVVVPLLLGHAYHARVDVPGSVGQATARHAGLRVDIAEVLGGDPQLADAALRRLAAVAGPLSDPDLGVVLAGVGSSHAPANAALAEVAAGWAHRHPWRGASPAFATVAAPSIPAAVAALRAAGARRVAVAQWILAPGLLPDRIAREARDAGAIVGAPLGADSGVAKLVVDRYTTAAASSVPAAQMLAS
jgi:sirohydrochlorin ferrochelatase